MRPGSRMLGALALVAAISLTAPAAAQDSRTLRVSFPSEDGTLTPYTFATGYPLVMLVYDSLTWRDARGVARPWLARSLRREAGGRRVVAKLRRGIRWHDGRRFSAADVVFTYRYVAEHSHPRFTPQVRDIESVSAPDADTVVFALRRASLGFEDQPLADVPILPRHLWEGLPAGQLAPAGLPVGTGPYRLTRHAVGRRYTFRANRDYFKGAPAPAASILQVPIVRSEQRAFDLLRNGDLDAAPVSLPAGALRDRSRRYRFADGVSFSGTMLQFNLAAGPFRDLAARRAVAQALDLDAIAGAQQGPGAMPPAEHGMLHPQSRWAGRRTLHRTDVAAARLAFTEGAVAPFAILASRNDGVRLEAARRVAGALRALGAPVRLEVLDAEQLERRLGRGGGAADFDAAVVGIPALASYDPAFLRNVFGDPQSAALNAGRYRSARFERLAERVASATTRAARRAAVDDELALLAADAPAVPLFFGGTTFAYRALDYAGWIDVQGSGILDKQSFLPRAAAARATAPAQSDPRDLEQPGEGVSLVPVIAGLAVLFVLAGVVAAARRRRETLPPRPRGR